MEVQQEQGLKNAFNNLVNASRMAKLSGVEHDEVKRSAMELRAALWPPKNEDVKKVVVKKE